MPFDLKRSFEGPRVGQRRNDAEVIIAHLAVARASLTKS